MTTICLCELSGEMYVLGKNNTGCELCTGGIEFTPENVERAFRFLEKRLQPNSDSHKIVTTTPNDAPTKRS